MKIRFICSHPIDISNIPIPQLAALPLEYGKALIFSRMSVGLRKKWALQNISNNKHW
jgi:hypothetical protein